MNARWRDWLVVGALATVLGCAADIDGPIATSVEEVRCGGTTCALPNATARCNRGRCAIAFCVAGGCTS